MVRRLGVLVVAAVAAVVLPSIPARAASATGAVGVQTESFVDHSRSTPADVVAGITPEHERRLPTTIFYPAQGKAAADGDADGGGVAVIGGRSEPVASAGRDGRGVATVPQAATTIARNTVAASAPIGCR